jgi:hypothetical protein
MHHISNAFFYQAEVTQVDRWEHGPLELVFMKEPESKRLECSALIHDWNSSQRAGFLRSGETIEGLKAYIPFLEERRNPNMVLVPTYAGTSELDVMLASLLPDALLDRYEIERRRPNLNLSFFHHDVSPSYGWQARSAFAQHIWTRLAPRARLGESAFAPNSPLRLLAGDTRFWAHRIYRLALDRRDTYFEPTTHDDKGWKPIEDLRKLILAEVPEDERHLFKVERPLMGGTIWEESNPAEREDVLQAAIDGDDVMESLEPVIDLLHRHRTHEDFSDRHSWIKEDFERSFYSKRARLKVDLVETIDDAPAYDLEPSEPYEQVLFRDVIAMLDQKERRLMIALRMGKNASTIARESGLRGHASVSRRIAALKAKITSILN